VKERLRPTDGVRPKKKLGQHFLTDEHIAEKIANTLSLVGYKHVIEIGPGTGVLTKFLIQKPIELEAIDLDDESIAYLQTKFIETHKPQNLSIRKADLLKLNLHEIFKGQPLAITGNFPYNISTQIVFKMLEHRDRVVEFTGMFQREVAERICEKPGSKAYGILSVLVQAFTVHPEVFNPPPKVQSGVIILRRKENNEVSCSEATLRHVVKSAFNQRRKTLRNSLKGLDISPGLKEDTIFDLRPEQLSVEAFIDLSTRIEHGDL
jgi:16S rRNA (adenine1518-N6/adenine1519-N6)-dimethyltransferase